MEPFQNYTIDNSKVFRHEGRTKYINSDNIKHLNELINIEILSENNRQLPFATFHLSGDVLPSVQNSQVEHFLRNQTVPRNKDSVCFPTLHDLGNTFDSNYNPTGIQCGVNVFPPRRLSHHACKLERSDLLDLISESVSDGCELESLKLKCDPETFSLFKRVKKINSSERQRNSVANPTDYNQSSGEEEEEEMKAEGQRIPTSSFHVPLVSIEPGTEQHLGQMILEGGLLGGGLIELTKSCECGIVNCKIPHKNLFGNLRNKSFFHVAYIQQFQMQSWNKSLGITPYSQPLQQFETILKKLSCMGRNETYQCCYPIIKTFIRFEQPYESNVVKNQSKFDMSAWTHFIRRCITASYDSGISYPWTYVGLPNTLFLTHLEDFMGINSVNLHIYGSPKIWIFVHEDDKELFEQTVLHILRDTAKYSFSGKSLSSKYFPSCFVGHKNFFVHPFILDQHGINYTIVIQNVGDLIVTKKNSYHWGINTGINVAYAQNEIFDDYILSLLNKVPDPFSSRPFCPPSTCMYKSGAPHFSTESEVFRFLQKVYEVLLLCQVETQINLSDISSMILQAASVNYEMDCSRSNQIKQAMQMIREEMINNLQKKRDQLKQLLLVVTHRKPIKLSSTITACTYEVFQPASSSLQSQFRIPPISQATAYVVLH